MVSGGCQCQIGFSSADCSVEVNEPPYKVELPKYGLCDRRYMSCDAVIVYGKNFVDSRTLKCHLKKCQVTIIATLRYEFVQKFTIFNTNNKLYLDTLSREEIMFISLNNC